MTILGLIVLGMVLGSFVNALVWRLYKQRQVIETQPKDIKQQLRALSIVRGRSMCVHCKHELAPKDLVPVFSWLFLRGRCRYCKKPIGDTPLAEVLLPGLFVASYVWWPYGAVWGDGASLTLFVVWLAILTCFMALALYDARWFILPDKLVAPLIGLAVLVVLLRSVGDDGLAAVNSAALGAVTMSGVFWAMWAISKGTWIGFGDVKLAIALGLLAGSPLLALLVIFIASLLGVVAALPRIVSGKRSIKSSLPFGPYLMTATVAVVFWGQTLYDWYFGLFRG